MGNDGGSIPRRCELVKEKKKEEKADPVESERAKWRVCTMTNEPLKEPIVVDDLGHLYNKESILNHLKVLKGISLDANTTTTTTSTTTSSSSSSQLPPVTTTSSAFSHITSLKDITQINCTRNTSLSKDKKIESSLVVICPITQLETGHYKFIVIRLCGCVMSERAIKEIPSDTCLVCGKAYNKEIDIIPLNPSPDELPTLKKRMEERKQQEKNSKKKRKSTETSEKSEKSEKTKSVHQSSTSTSKNVDDTSVEKKKKKAIDNLLPPSTTTTQTTTTSTSTTKKSIPLPMTTKA